MSLTPFPPYIIGPEQANIIRARGADALAQRARDLAEAELAGLRDSLADAHELIAELQDQLAKPCTDRMARRQEDFNRGLAGYQAQAAAFGERAAQAADAHLEAAYDDSQSGGEG